MIHNHSIVKQVSINNPNYASYVQKDKSSRHKRIQTVERREADFRHS